MALLARKRNIQDEEFILNALRRRRAIEFLRTGGKARSAHLLVDAKTYEHCINSCLAWACLRRLWYPYHRIMRRMVCCADFIDNNYHLHVWALFTFLWWKYP